MAGLLKWRDGSKKSQMDGPSEFVGAMGHEFCEHGRSILWVPWKYKKWQWFKGRISWLAWEIADYKCYAAGQYWIWINFVLLFIHPPDMIVISLNCLPSFFCLDIQWKEMFIKMCINMLNEIFWILPILNFYPLQPPILASLHTFTIPFGDDDLEWKLSANIFSFVFLMHLPNYYLLFIPFKILWSLFLYWV